MSTQGLGGVVLVVLLTVSGASAQELLGELRPTDMGGHASFGAGLALLGDVAFAGAPGQNARGACSGAVHVLRAAGDTWEEQLLLMAVDTAAGDRFGTSCALDGERALVGAPGRDGGGGAYVFRREGAAWIEEAFLPPAEGGAEGFGIAVALLGDTALVLDHNQFQDYPIQAYVFRLDGAAWLLEAKLPISLLANVEPTAAMVEDTIFMVTSDFSLNKRVYVFMRDDHETPSIQDDTWVLQSQVHAPTTYGHASLAADGGRLAVGTPQTPTPPYPGAVSIYERSDSGTPSEPLDDVWNPTAAFASPAHSPVLDDFGWSIALEGEVLVVTSPLAEPGPLPDGPAFGGVDILRFDGAHWQPEAHLVGPAATGGFGHSCASSGDRALVWDSQADDLGPATGSLSPLVHGASAWFLADHLLPAGLHRVGCFGYAVDAAGGDGATIAVGAQLTDSEAGNAYVFEATSEGWLQTAQIVPVDPAPGDRFGSSIALDGDLLIVGAHQRDEVVTDQGGAYVFSRSGEGWTQDGVLVAPEPCPSAYFGAAVALSDELALVGAHGDCALGPQAGAAYVFRRIGTSWALEAILHAPDAAPGAAFGKAVALEGGRALVGAPEAESAAGACYVFQEQGGSWLLEQRLVAGDGQPGDRFGYSCALSDKKALVGAWRADLVEKDTGAAYMFALNPITGIWSEEQKLIPSEPNPSLSGWYGSAVALEGPRALCARPTSALGSNGSTAVYRLEESEKMGGTWIDIEIIDSNLLTLPWQVLGLDVDLDGAVAAIGAPALTGPEPHDFDFAGAVLLVPSETPALVGAPVSVSSSAGGTQTLLLDAPETEAGLTFLVMGSLSGTEPGLSLGPWTLPLNPDAYFMLVLNEPDQPPASGFLGVLDPSGDAQAAVVLAPGEATPLGHETAEHAFAVLDFAAGAITFVSNAAPLKLHP